MAQPMRQLTIFGVGVFPQMAPATERDMNPKHFDPRKTDRFRLVQSELSGTTTDSWGIEVVIRALAGSRAPILPTADGSAVDQTQYLAYWHGLHYLAVARLGWRDPGRGFRTWRKLGRPIEDPTLAFISSVWRADGNLDAYVAWATLHHKELTSADSPKPAQPPSDSSLRWARGVRDKAGLELLCGGWNPPHFGTAASESESIRDSGRNSSLTVTDMARRRAVYTTGAQGFYVDLTSRWSELPDITPNDWRVDAFDRRLGFLGTYRLSRITGRLFTGKHSVHMLGN